MMQLPSPVTSRSRLPDDGGRRRGSRASRVVLPVAAAMLAAAGVVVGVRMTHNPTPTPSPTPVPTSNAAGALQWAPPALSHPTTISLSAKSRSVELNPDRDYRLVMPKTPLTLKGGLSITGGHNIVLVGGTLVVPSAKQAPDPQDRRGMYLKGQTGIVHIEGLRLAGDLSEGFDLDERLGATVQIENVDVATVHGTRDANHADVIQTWAGPTKLLVDGLRASSDYQGLFLLPNQHWNDGPSPHIFDIRRSVITLSDGAGYGVWVPDAAPWMHADGLTIVTSKTDRGNVLWPASQLNGVQLAATAATADKSPDGTPGLEYQTPGYREGAGS